MAINPLLPQPLSDAEIDERWSELCKQDLPWATKIRALLNAERERCAELCEAHSFECWDYEGGSLWCAEAIREQMK